MYKFKKRPAKIIILYVIFCIIFLICSALLLFMNSRGGEQKTAYIYIDGDIYMVVDLFDKIYTQYTISTEYGLNIVEVNNGKIRVIEADCPDKTCVEFGYTSSERKPIICIPNKLEIIIAGNELDGVA